MRLHTIFVTPAAGQIRIRGLNQKMIVIGHQAIYGDSYIVQFHRIHEQLNEYLEISLRQKDRFSPPATIHHMLPNIWILYSQQSIHITPDS